MRARGVLPQQIQIGNQVEILEKREAEVTELREQQSANTASRVQVYDWPLAQGNGESIDVVDETVKLP